MNIRQLKQFLSIAQTGNISRSAKEQNISQPALTRSIKTLEESLNAELIERRANGVCLTPYGERLLDYAHVMVNDYNRVRGDIKAMQTGSRGKLTIGVGPTFSITLLPGLLKRLLKDRPKLQLHIIENLVEDLCIGLRNGTFDVILSLFPESQDFSALSFIKFCQVSSVVVARSGHPLAQHSNVTRQQLAQYDWIVADQKYAENIIRGFLNRMQIPIDAHRISTNSTHVITAMLINSDCLSILPRMLIEHELDTNQLTMIDGVVKPIVSMGGLACRDSGFQSAVLKDFVQIVKDEFHLQ